MAIKARAGTTSAVGSTLGEVELRERILANPLPRHVAIIMDGNGRWATSRGLPRVAGHAEGVKAVRNTVRAAGEIGVEYLTLYAFSSENWNRPRHEVSTLMNLLERSIDRELPELMQRNVRFREIGDAMRRLAREVQEGRIGPDEIDEVRVGRALYTDGVPDPDLLIRTSGEMRVSNFLLWQIAYTELWVTPTRWPDFEARDLFLAVADFQQRNRRFGRV